MVKSIHFRGLGVIVNVNIFDSKTAGLRYSIANLYEQSRSGAVVVDAEYERQVFGRGGRHLADPPKPYNS